MKLILCRHGETDYNNEHRYQGTTETSINESGKKQALLISELLKKEEIDYVFSSPRNRCMQTAKIISKPHKLPVKIREDLREINYGFLEGHTVLEIKNRFPGIWEEREKSKYDYAHANGESFAHADEARVKPMLAEFREKYSSRCILVVTHQGIGRLIIGSLLGIPPIEKMKVTLPNDCVYFIDYGPHTTKIRYARVDSGITGDGFYTRPDLV
ncbi:MAG: histidine phosphatase family protein [archaeon]|nr:histidine phosphatase family protein [archaeon]